MTVEKSCRACRCGVRYEPAELAALRPVQTLGPEEVAAHTIGWPSDVAVDVRECASCRAPIASLQRVL